MVDQSSGSTPAATTFVQKPQFQMGRVLSRSFSGVYKNWKSIALAMLVLMGLGLISSLPLLIAEGTTSDDFNAILSNPFVLGVTIISGILSFFFYMFICVFTDIVAFGEFTKRHVTFKDAFWRAVKASLPILFICILMMIAAYIGMIFLIVPGVIISVGWAIIGPIYLHEDVSLFGTFGRSWQLTHGYKWWVWLSQIIMNIILMFVMIVPIAIIGAAFAAGFSADPEALAEGTTLSTILLSTVLSFGYYIMLSLYASFTCAVYAELREVKEGLSIEGAAAIFD